jgi:hypothetical protein
MIDKTDIPAFFEGPPPLFKPTAAEEKTVQTYETVSRKLPRRKLHLRGNKEAGGPAEDVSTFGILATSIPDTD